MNRQQFLYRFLTCYVYFKKLRNLSLQLPFEEQYTIYYVEIEGNDYLHCLGPYSESFYDRFFSDYIYHKGQKSVPLSSNYFKYYFDKNNFLSYVFCYSDNNKKLWQFMPINEKTKFGFCDSQNEIVVSHRYDAKHLEYHNLYWDTSNNKVNLYYNLEESYFDEKTIRCHKSLLVNGIHIAMDYEMIQQKKKETPKEKPFILSSKTNDYISKMLEMSNKQQKAYQKKVEEYIEMYNNMVKTMNRSYGPDTKYPLVDEDDHSIF